MLQLAVVEIAGAWRVLLDGERIGGFAEQAEAVNCAADAARTAQSAGLPVEVLVQDVCGEVTQMPLGGRR